MALQFDVAVPEGTDVNKVLLNEIRKDGHVVAMKKMSDGSYRMLAYSMQNRSLRGNDGLLATLQLDCMEGEILLTNIHLTDEQLTDHVLSDVKLSIQTGISTLVQTPTFDIYDLNGRLVRRDATTTKGLSRGVYIINNKVVIK